MIKLEKFNEILKNPQAKLDYFSAFEFSEVTVREIYPEKRNFPLYNRSVEDFSSLSLSQIPVLLLDSINQKYHFGVLEIKVFNR